jgi:hypothetical protein
VNEVVHTYGGIYVLVGFIIVLLLPTATLQNANAGVDGAIVGQKYMSRMQQVKLVQRWTA